MRISTLASYVVESLGGIKLTSQPANLPDSEAALKAGITLSGTDNKSESEQNAGFAYGIIVWHLSVPLE
jgi:hypothetical protein